MQNDEGIHCVVVSIHFALYIIIGVDECSWKSGGKGGFEDCIIARHHRVLT